ncbi:SAM-dependent methyltransferase, partial [Streptomyces sp. NPDC051956]
MSTPPTHAGRPFDELVTEAADAPVEGWDFSWFEGRATEERPSWGYARAMGERMGRASAGLDLQTGGGGGRAPPPPPPPPRPPPPGGAPPPPPAPPRGPPPGGGGGA